MHRGLLLLAGGVELRLGLVEEALQGVDDAAALALVGGRLGRAELLLAVLDLQHHLHAALDGERGKGWQTLRQPLGLLLRVRDEQIER